MIEYAGKSTCEMYTCEAKRYYDSLDGLCAELNVFRAGFSGESLTSIKQGVFTQPNNCQPVLNQLFVCFFEVWSIHVCL